MLCMTQILVIRASPVNLHRGARERHRSASTAPEAFAWRYTRCPFVPPGLPRAARLVTNRLVDADRCTVVLVLAPDHARCRAGLSGISRSMLWVIASRWAAWGEYACA